MKTVKVKASKGRKAHTRQISDYKFAKGRLRNARMQLTRIKHTGNVMSNIGHAEKATPTTKEHYTKEAASHKALRRKTVTSVMKKHGISAKEAIKTLNK